MIKTKRRHQKSVSHSSPYNLDVPEVKPGRVLRYLKGFAKRVVICSLLVLVCKTLWPHVQPVIWPETPAKV